jgi:hypothetical protein
VLNRCQPARRGQNGGMNFRGKLITWNQSTSARLEKISRL